MYGLRAIYAVSAALFCFTLGSLALWRNHKHPLNRSFAFFNYSNMVLQLVGMARGFVFNVHLDHNLSLFLYRAGFQLSGYLTTYYLIAFSQHLMGNYTTRFAFLMRRVLQIIIIGTTPFIFTRLFYVDFYQGAGWNVTEKFGPFFPVYVAINMGFQLTNIYNIYDQFEVSIGLKRNQIKFLLFAVACAFLAAASKGISSFHADLNFITFILQLAMTFLLAYTIFKYRLLEFNRSMKWVSLNAGFYSVFLGLPFVFLLVLNIKLTKLTSAYLIAFYGIILTLIPSLINLIKDKSEHKRLLYIRQQFNFILESVTKLSEAHPKAIKAYLQSVLNILRDLYWSKLRNPLDFILIMSFSSRKGTTVTHFPDRTINVKVFDDFMAHVRASKDLLQMKNFSRLDIEHKIITGQTGDAGRWEKIIYYLKTNEIEICIPCVYENQIFGIILLGAKEKGFFGENELDTLYLISNQIAQAVHRENLIDSNAELKNLDELKTELISKITHEFKTPLVVIENVIEDVLLDAAKGSLKSEKVKKYLLMAKNNSSLLGNFIQDLLNVAKIEKTKVELQTENVFLHDVAQKAVATMKPLADRKNLLIKCHFNLALRMRIDEDKMSQVFHNLISNAIKNTDGGEIRFTIHQQNSDALIEVADTGRGIEKKYLNKIFDKFIQVPNSSPYQTEGTGLGLTIAKGWVEAHGGTIWAESKGLGMGTTFKIKLTPQNAI